MRFLSWLQRAVVLLVVVAAGCQTDRDGVEVDVAAALRAYRERVDRKPCRAQVDQIIAGLKAEQLNDLGVLYEREGRLEDAAWAYQRAVWQDLRFAQAYVNLGNVLRKQGKREEARLRYRQAMAADPSNFEAVNNFADLCAEEGSHCEEAIALLAPMAEIAGAHRAYGLDTLGWLYHLRGDDVRATALLEAALQEAGAGDFALRATVHEHLATTYVALGRLAEAAQHEAAARLMRPLTCTPGKSEQEIHSPRKGGETLGDEHE